MGKVNHELNMVLKADPTLGLGIPANIGIYGVHDKGVTSDIWLKTGVKHTDWTLDQADITSSAGTGDDERVIRAAQFGGSGNDGADGVDGIDGTNGTNGTNGVDGADGADGADGVGGSPITTNHFYVDKNGVDTNAGSLDAPYLTINAAVTYVNANIASNIIPVIHVGTGLFSESFTITHEQLILLGVEGVVDNKGDNPTKMPTQLSGQISINHNNATSTVIIKNISMDQAVGPCINILGSFEEGSVTIENVSLNVTTSGHCLSSSKNGIALSAYTLSIKNCFMRNLSPLNQVLQILGELHTIEIISSRLYSIGNKVAFNFSGGDIAATIIDSFLESTSNNNTMLQFGGSSVLLTLTGNHFKALLGTEGIDFSSPAPVVIATYNYYEFDTGSGNIFNGDGTIKSGNNLRGASSGYDTFVVTNIVAA